MSIATVLTLGYGSFGTVNFVPTLGYLPGQAVTVIIDTHDGEEKKRDRKKRDDKLRLHNQIEEAFTDALGLRPPAPIEARADAPTEQFIFPAYREMPAVDEDDEDNDFLLLSL